jgi:hypothetical protein
MSFAVGSKFGSTRPSPDTCGIRKSDRPSSLGLPTGAETRSYLLAFKPSDIVEQSQLVFKVTWVNSKISQRVLWPPTTME